MPTHSTPSRGPVVVELAHLPGDDGERPLLGADQSLGPFHLFDVWAMWDHPHRQAALAWLERPFWP